MALVCVDDYEQAAKENLTKCSFDVFGDGAANCTTVQWNKSAYKRLRVLPRCLQNVSKLHLETSIFGCRLSMPVGISPTAAQHLAHPDADIANAKAAAGAGVIFTASHFSSFTLEEIAEACPNGTKWFQTYMYEDNNTTWNLIARAECAGYKALVITVDSPQFGCSNALRRMRLGSVPNMRPDITGNFPKEAKGDSKYHALDMSFNWENGIRSIVERTSLPVIGKGILRPSDALKAIEAGCQAIIVSNHGGRNLDTTPPTIEALPGIVKAVNGRVPIIIDGGIRLGTDVLKALALGADLVFMGRPAIWGLAVAGQKGVEDVLGIIRQELETAMRMVGVANTKDICKDIVVHESTYEQEMIEYLKKTDM